MSKQWFYSKGEDNLGPYTIDQMKQYAHGGEIEPADLVWREGWAEWKIATEVEELEIAQPPPPPAPSRPPPLPAKPKTAEPTIATSPSLADSAREMVPSVYWNVVLIAAAGFFFLAMFVPWWRITWSNASTNRSLANRVYQAKAAWYSDHVGPTKRFRFEYDRDSMRGTASMWLWGWNTRAGTIGFVMVFFIVPLAVVPIYVKVLRPWVWIGRFAMIAPGLVLFLLFLTWFIDAPSENVEPVLAQGLVAGPYFTLLGSLCVLTVGVGGGIYGLLEFVEAVKIRRQRFAFSGA